MLLLKLNSSNQVHQGNLRTFLRISKSTAMKVSKRKQVIYKKKNRVWLPLRDCLLRQQCRNHGQTKRNRNTRHKMNPLLRPRLFRQLGLAAVTRLSVMTSFPEPKNFPWTLCQQNITGLSEAQRRKTRSQMFVGHTLHHLQ